MKELNWQYWTN